MGINPTSGTGAVNWGELLAQVENAKTGGTEGAGGVFNGKSVTITTQADGTARTLTVPVARACISLMEAEENISSVRTSRSQMVSPIKANRRAGS